MKEETTEPEAQIPETNDSFCIDCSILAKEEDRKKCEELTTELAKETIDMETFSNALINELIGDEGEKADKLLSVFCDVSKVASKEENKDKEGLIWQK